MITATPPAEQGAAGPTRRSRSLAVARSTAIVALALVGAGLVGMVTESVLARGDGERYPIPGRVVAADQGSLHLNCTGTGSPTILLEAGLGEPGLTWAEVQDELDQFFTVCSYDRAGYGWSPPGAGAWDAEVASLQISQALRAADNNGPYVIAAHSVGSLVARELRHREPEAVAGMILLDPTNEVMLDRLGTPGGAIVERTLMGALAHMGIVRMFGDWLIPSFAGSPPPEELLGNAPAAYHPGAIAASTRELHGGPYAAAHLLAVEDSDWADLPLTVISAATTTEGDLDHHRDLASRSSAGRHLTAESGGHYIHYDDPQLVVDAICDVVSAVTERRNC